MSVDLQGRPSTGPAAQRPAPPTRIRIGSSRGAKAWYAFAALLALFIAAPVITFFARMFEGGGSAFVRLTQIPDIWNTVLTTVVLAAGSTAIAGTIAVALAVAAIRVPPAMRAFAAIAPQIPLVIPPVASVYGWIFILDPDAGYANVWLRSLPFFEQLESGPINVYTIGAIILFTGVETSGMVFAFVYARLVEINGSVDAAARVAGASAFRSFTTISLPLLRPGLIAGVVVAFLTGIGQFTAPLFLGTRDGIDVVSTEIFRLREQFPIDYPLTSALGLPLLLFGIAAIVIQQRVVGDQRRYITQTSGRGITRKASVGAIATVLSFVLVVIVLPMTAVVLVAFSPFWNGDLSNLSFTGDNLRAALSNPAVGESIYNSLVASFLAALIVIPLGFTAALALSGVIKAPWIVTRALDFIFIAPMAVPRAVLGMVVLFVFIRPPFSLYGTLALFVIGYIFIAIPFALRSQYASLIGVDRALFEAARVAGAGRMTMIGTIAIPVARRGIAASAALAFVMLTNDFAVSVMVQSPGQQVMGTLLYQYSQEGAAPSIAVMSLIMSVITALILALTLRIGGKSALEGI